MQLHRQVFANNLEARSNGGDRHDLACIVVQRQRYQRTIQADLLVLSQLRGARAGEACRCSVAATGHEPRPIVCGEADHRHDASGANRDEGLDHAILHEHHRHIPCGAPCEEVLVVRREGHATVFTHLLPRAAHLMSDHLATLGVEVPQSDGLPPASRGHVLVGLPPLYVFDHATTNDADRGLRAEHSPRDDKVAACVINKHTAVHDICARVQEAVVVGKAEAVDAMVLLLETEDLLLCIEVPEDDVSVLTLLTRGAEAAAVGDR
mmetsp:Transcript_47722/g.102284  ORF Transcript_47722/g.102284 Transcript_47722/m.102284 type:complete len:265 (+) Transcript_47722:1032-1826(+)